MKVGFIGLGTMGRPMALHLVRGGHELAVWARRAAAAEPLHKAGARVCASPAEVAQNADVVFTVVTAAADTEAVVLGANGIVHGARAGTVVVDMATISPLATRRIASSRTAGSATPARPISSAREGDGGDWAFSTSAAKIKDLLIQCLCSLDNPVFSWLQLGCGQNSYLMGGFARFPKS